MSTAAAPAPAREAGSKHTVMTRPDQAKMEKDVAALEAEIAALEREAEGCEAEIAARLAASAANRVRRLPPMLSRPCAGRGACGVPCGSRVLHSNVRPPTQAVAAEARALFNELRCMIPVPDLVCHVMRLCLCAPRPAVPPRTP